MAQGRRGGWFELISGGMFSGKTEELIRRVRRAGYARQKVQVFKPALDARYESGDVRAVSSHTGWQVEAVAVSSTSEILELVDSDTGVVAIDEAQFFDPEIVAVCEELASRDIRVIVAGLNLDALGRSFGSMAELMVQADQVTTLNAICVVCGNAASRTQLLRAGEPVPLTEGPLILVGGEDVGYEARCRRCHEVPGKPERRGDEKAELG